MQHGGSLVLRVALAGKAGQLVEEQRAVGDVVVRGQGVRQHAGLAALVNVRAVGARAAAGSGGAVAGDGAQAGGDRAASGRGGRLEVLVEFARGAGGGGRGGCGCEAVAVAQGGADGGEAGAGAVALDGGAFGHGLHGFLDGGGFVGVDVDRDVVARVGEDGAGKGGRVGIGVLDEALREDVVLAALGEVVQLCEFDLDFDGFAGFDRSEGLGGKRVGGHALEHALESSRRSCCFVSLVVKI